MLSFLAGRRGRAIVATIFLAVLAACGGGGDEAGTTDNKFACFDFLARVTSGPGAGKSWTGDLVLTQDDTGAFTGLLVPVGQVDRTTLEVRDPSGAICRAIGQRNGAQVSWFLYCQNNERIFGQGQITVTANNDQELRGITQGPADNDFGIYHGRNYPPYIRTISGD